MRPFRLGSQTRCSYLRWLDPQERGGGLTTLRWPDREDRVRAALLRNAAFRNLALQVVAEKCAASAEPVRLVMIGMDICTCTRCEMLCKPLLLHIPPTPPSRSCGQDWESLRRCDQWPLDPTLLVQQSVMACAFHVSSQGQFSPACSNVFLHLPIRMVACLSSSLCPAVTLALTSFRRHEGTRRGRYNMTPFTPVLSALVVIL